MNSPETENVAFEGLGLSVLVYMAAIVGGLALIAVPVYFANGPRVYDNPPLARASPLLNGPVIGQRETARTPLAVLKHQTIVDPKFVAALNAKVKQPEQRRISASRQVAQRPHRQSVAELPVEPRQPQFFLFRLFGG
jgi:hypothetical protein